MATLQEEMTRFLNARFGADVKDAFISCIQKIHAENLDVVALEESMETVASEVSQNKADILAAVQEAEDEAAEATSTAADAKTIARSAESNASQALATANNASYDAFNATGDAQNAVAAAQEMQNAYATLQLMMSAKIDGAFVENGYLYLTSDNEVVAGPLGPFSGSGGGGGSAGNNAVLAVSNVSGWLSKSVAYGNECEVQVLWSSVEDNIPTGNGVMKITVNGIVKAMLDIAQGTVTTDISPYLSVGSNAVKITVSDVYENSRTVNYSVNAIDISMSSAFDVSVPFTGNINFTYTPVGNVAKVIKLYLDGVQLTTVNTTASGRQMSYSIPAQEHGAHTLEAYFTATVNGQTVESNHLYYEFISLESLNSDPVIVSSFHEEEVSQYTSLAIPFMVYDPASLTSEVTLYVNGSVVSRQTVDSTQQLWTYRADNSGTLVLEISSGDVSRTFNITVTESDIEVDAETDSLALFLSSYGRSNNEENPDTWEYGSIEADFSDFNFTSDGWQRDADNVSVLRVAGDARLTIPLKPFAQDFRSTGKTIELEFATKDVMNYDSVVMSCMSGGRGFEITPQLAVLKSEQTDIRTQYKENEHVRISFVVEKRSEHRLIYCYINGIMSGVVRYPEDDDFSQTTPVNITVGSNDATIDLYCIRVYNNDLTRHQVLKNWIADTQVVEELLARYARNNVFDDYSKIVISQLPSDLPYMILEAEELPQYKGDKKTISGSYVDPVTPSKSFTFTGAQADVQGTSSQYYARKNYKIKFREGFVMQNGNTAENYAMRSGSVPTNTFTFKADVASSEGANNVELVRLYNDACPYRTEPQKDNANIRQGIDGFPIVMFWYDGENTTFLGKYNFNNDKGTPEVFGFEEGDESWEILNNTSDRVLWKSDDFTGEDWLNDFEGRYPDGNEDSTNLKALATWLKSTDQSAATGAALPAPKTYEGVRYVADTATYRLAKFKNEFPQHFEKDAMLFYYLFTELFLMVDSRAKNAFPTFMSGSKWFSLPYDMDTAIGINNEGTLAFSYNLEDIDQTETGGDVYNGQQSVLWLNLRQAFFSDLKAMYQNLRSTGALSYSKVETAFETHQAKWPEAVFNEDAYFKYLAPLFDDGTAAYLSMLQGSKAEQRKWWLYNRFKYLDSKYNAGDSLSDVITLRGYAKDDITVTPYADIYATVKFGSYLTQTRAARNEDYTMECPLDNVNDTEIYIYSASQLKSVGDLSGLKVGYADFALATKLQELKIGDSDEDYSNTNLTELHLGNNVLLRTIDVRNCPNLTQAVDISGCANIEEVHFEGTNITGLLLPNGGILKKLYLPESITNLTIRNQTGITEFEVPSFDNISTLRLENVSDAVDCRTILESVPANTRVRITGFAWDVEDADEIFELYDLLDTMRGLDENGNNMESAQMLGTINIETVTGDELMELQSRYPYITINYAHRTAQLTFYNYDGSTQLRTETVTDCADGTYGGTTPTRASTTQYSYTFAGWSLSANGSANANALTNVTVDRSVYAAFTATIRKYTVRFYNNSSGSNVLLQTVTNVPYGNSAAYTGATPVNSVVSELQFLGWDPEPTSIHGDTDCMTVFESPYELKEIEDSWETIIESVENRTYAGRYMLGNYKPVDLGTYGVINMQIVGMDVDTDRDGMPVPLSFLAMNLLNTNQYSLVTGSTTTDEGGSSARRYSSSNIRTLITGAVRSAIPQVIRDRLVPTKRICRNTYSGKEIETIYEDVWAPSSFEVNSNTTSEEGIKYRTIKHMQSGGILKALAYGTDTAGGYALRDSYSSTCLAGMKTGSVYASQSATGYIRIGFCLGMNTISDSWDDILDSIEDGSYSTKYEVGQVKPLEIDGQTHYMQLIAMDEDDLADNTGKAKTTWLSVDTFKFCAGNRSTLNSCSWKTNSVLKTDVQSLYDTLPDKIKAAIKEVSKVSRYSSTDSTTIDKVWIPSLREVKPTGLAANNTNLYNYPEGSGVAYSYFSEASTYKQRRIRSFSGEAVQWLLRTGSSGQASIAKTGSDDFKYFPSGQNPYYVPLGFCI